MKITKKILQEVLQQLDVTVTKGQIKRSSILAALKKVIASDPSLKPPKEWWEVMKKKVKKNNPDYTAEQVKKTIGDIWYHELSEGKRKAIRNRYGKKYGPAKKK